MRTLLTLLQIVLGALAMTLALSIYFSAAARQNADSAERFDLVAGYREDGTNTSYSVMDAAGAAELLTLAPDVEKVALHSQVWNSTFEVGGKLYQFQGGAHVDDAYFELNKVEATRGSLFTRQEADAKEAVVLISDGAADILFPDADPLGQTLTLMPGENFGGPAGSPQPYKVIGTFAEKREPSIQQDYVYLPAWMLSDTMSGSDTLSILAKPGRGDAAREQVLSAVRQVFKEKMPDQNVEVGKDFYIRELGDTGFGRNSDLLDPTVVMFSLFGIVALIVGGIGIFSIVVVDAVERERDIGIKRALGATRGRVVRELTLEAALLSGLGGLVGVALAAFVIPLLDRQVGDNLFWSVDLRWQPLAALLVVGVTLLLGTVLGVFPALRAGRTRIVEALKAA